MVLKEEIRVLVIFCCKTLLVILTVVAWAKQFYHWTKRRHLMECIVLLHVLEHINFSVPFRTQVSLFYASISSSVLVNGEKSEPFYVAQGFDKDVLCHHSCIL